MVGLSDMMSWVSATQVRPEHKFFGHSGRRCKKMFMHNRLERHALPRLDRIGTLARHKSYLVFQPHKRFNLSCLSVLWWSVVGGGKGPGAATKVRKLAWSSSLTLVQINLGQLLLLPKEVTRYGRNKKTTEFVFLQTNRVRYSDFDSDLNIRDKIQHDAIIFWRLGVVTPCDTWFHRSAPLSFDVWCHYASRRLFLWLFSLFQELLKTTPKRSPNIGNLLTETTQRECWVVCEGCGFG